MDIEKMRIEVSSSVVFGDLRLNHRFSEVIGDLSSNLGCGSIPCVLQERKKIKGYYRFINNKKVSNFLLLEGLSAYVSSLTRRLSDSSVVLAIQDTTELDFTGKRSSDKLGVLEYAHRHGIYLHNHLLVSGSGVPLGLFSQKFHHRKAEDLGKSRAKRYAPVEEKESYKWVEEFNHLQDTFANDSHLEIISVCDREADMYEMLCARKYSHIHLIIRSQYNRVCINEAGEKGGYLWDEVGSTDACFCYWLEIEDVDRKKRTAHLEARYRKVTLRPPHRKGLKLPIQDIWILEVKEVNPPKEVSEPLCWQILTTIPIENAQIAQKIIYYYTLRWIIERFHYILKQCLHVEKLQVEEEQPLQNAIILQSWVAVQIANLDYLNKKTPQASLSQTTFSNEDYDLAYKYATKVLNFKALHNPNPTVNDFAIIIARIAGHQLQKNKAIGAPSLIKGIKSFLIIKETAIKMSQ